MVDRSASISLVGALHAMLTGEGGGYTNACGSLAHMSICSFRFFSSSAIILDFDPLFDESDAEDSGWSPASTEYGVNEPTYGNADEYGSRGHVAT